MLEHLLALGVFSSSTKVFIETEHGADLRLPEGWELHRELRTSGSLGRLFFLKCIGY